MGFLSFLGGGTGAYKSSIKSLEKNRDQELSYWNSRAHADYLNDSENQSALKQARELLRESASQAQARAVVSGATDESVALQKQANNEAMGNIISNIAADSSNKKDQAMQAYLSATRDYTNSINNLKIQKDQAQTQALGGLLSSGISLAGGLWGGKLGSLLSKTAQSE
jgi:hypothetical protein